MTFLIFRVQRQAAHHKRKAIAMIGKITAAAAAALLLASVGAASARPTLMSEQVFPSSVEHYDGLTYPHSTERYCYMPSSPCGNNHRMTN
jgi:hypothetical protein